MKRTLAVTVLIALAITALGSVLPAAAQRGQRRAPNMGRDQGFSGRQMVNRKFDTVAPAVGESMPDITVYDETGNPLSLEQVLRGHYSVVVLGCLT